MPALQVRDFPEELYGQLKEYAAANHRSIAQQTIIAVEEMLADAAGILENAASSEDGRSKRYVADRIPTELSGEAQEAISFPGFVDHDSAARAARIERRKQLFKEFDEIPWRGPELSTEDIVAMVREGRDYMSERSWRALEPAALESLWEEEAPL